MNPADHLRPAADEDVETMRQWRNDPRVRANMYTQHEIGEAEHRAWWERTRASPAHRYFVAMLDGKACGVVGFSHIDPVHGHAFWAFYSAPDAPPGSGSRMEVLALDHAFGPLRLHKLCCEVLAYNQPVLRLHRKFGFDVEGIFREHYATDTGRVDVHRLAIFERDWQQRRGEIIDRLAQRKSRSATAPAR
ncbi:MULTISPECIES: UDP-4-amino-4,6-dideoxy-N-acetyl-beta-L-altrosamine N-acetyltransferase [unclassified Rubrivivax]|uniref:UDP-4-amino-4, 6-dideoxy-N-acetyl-beta-L-altrosamine N-acetyltransferase n=1 Tax=unclassified Rubrivivax TaxID=2649762 RepID=UPI001E4A8ADE|nr:MULTISPECIES: UDP-4-amino-4,6-dideoxy-N-acetyl-beta-L-altrosamine N-acetyltransferase [unclassified Rubrivivax]MCC9595857.1 UDP-4-amino-4,6-dideoxy-N-acetyl-beta-L-altrosamine N-acetyltransferase [Rubrivivax sp. JA1055]MCC9647803.1 UDP-4-amino-4,6-dideoxy-N-acetyl-beta-L-altrosamine N-acetyltransferase [Rubrivivax sp. JA1029]